MLGCVLWHKNKFNKAENSHMLITVLPIVAYIAFYCTFTSINSP